MRGVSVVIKAFNETENIDRAVESALAAVAVTGGEVILADSASTDETVDRARRHPITIAVLKDGAERSCGIGPELGFRHSRCDLVYVMDGDMALMLDFLPKAIAALAANPGTAGVGGLIRETRVENLVFQSRVNRQARHRIEAATEVSHLAGGGLYRRRAIEAAGYLSDRNLHAFEELDLGLRLGQKGLKLIRLPDHATDHFAYRMSTRQLMLHRLRSGNFTSCGEVLRAAVDGGYAAALVKNLRLALLAAGTLLYWLAALIVGIATGHVAAALALAAIGVAAAVAVMAVRHRSVGVGALSILSWHLSAAGLLPGFFRRRTPPTAPIDATVVAPSAADAGGITKIAN